MSTRRSYGMAVLVVIIAAAVTSGFGQSQRAPATMDDLLAEVRGLRADLNRSSNDSVQAQLLVARLTLQEQRINALGRQLADLQPQLETVIRERTQEEERFKRLEEDLANGNVSPVQLRDVEVMQTRTKASISQRQLREQQLKSQQMELADLIAVEQHRWTDFNARLDDLERSLTDGRGR